MSAVLAIVSHQGDAASLVGKRSGFGMEIQKVWGGKRPSEFRPHARRHGAGRL